ncbi:MAG: glutamyl-tRNA reductase [Bacteroidetes bacterium]|nr:glutamyl-tRNA reductase [Bacteroidota bacterium]
MEKLALLHLNEEAQSLFLGKLKVNFNFDELLHLSTCNRVEFFVCTDTLLNETTIQNILKFVNPQLSVSDLKQFASSAELFEGDEAINHVFELASSLKSLVVGEREIITQVRKAYELCNGLNLTGDFTRLLVKQTIETAKEVFTNTDIAKNPVSVVSLAYRQLRDLGIKNEAKIIMVGSGETNTNMANYLQKHKYANFTIFNRTLSNAETLAQKLNATAFSLNDLTTYNKGFDVLITCTGSTEPVITDSVYQTIKAGDNTKKVIIDLALPADVDKQVIENNNIHYIDINSLKSQAEKNLDLRKGEVDKCRAIIKTKLEEFISLYNERKIELAFGEIPKQVKAIKELAMNEVFSKEINSLDDKSKEVLDKVLNYVEKKYNAVAMKTAKEVLLSKD